MNAKKPSEKNEQILQSSLLENSKNYEFAFLNKNKLTNSNKPQISPKKIDTEKISKTPESLENRKGSSKIISHQSFNSSSAKRQKSAYLFNINLNKEIVNEPLTHNLRSKSYSSSKVNSHIDIEKRRESIKSRPESVTKNNKDDKIETNKVEDIKKNISLEYSESTNDKKLEVKNEEMKGKIYN